MSLFPTLQKLAPNENLLFSTRFAGVTLESPDSFAGASCWRHISGVDTATGFSYADIADLPLKVKPSAGGGLTGYGGYGMLYINSEDTLIHDPFGFPSNDLTGLEEVFPSRIQDRIIRGSKCRELEVDTLNSRGWFRTQTWLTLYRYFDPDTPDLPELCIDTWITLPDFAGLELFSPTIATKRHQTILDVKTGSPTPGIFKGDFRYALSVKMSQANLSGTDWDEADYPAGTMGFELVIDNNANHDGYGTTFPAETFAKIRNYEVHPPIEEPFRLSLYWKRAPNYANEELGLVKVIMQKQDGSIYKLFDINKQFIDQWNQDNPKMPRARNVHMGIEQSRIHRMFCAGCYFGGVDNSTTAKLRVHSLDIWDGIPYILPE